MEHVKEMTRRFFIGLDGRFRATDGVPGMPTGVPSLDNAGGLFPGEVLVVAGQPGSGKTALALSIAIAAAGQNTSVLYFALADTTIEIGERMLVNQSKVNNVQLRRGQLDRNAMTSMVYAAAGVSKLPFAIDDSTDQTATTLRSTVTGWRESIDPDHRALIVVDYVQLLAPEQSTGNRDYELAAAVRTIVNTAKAAQAVVVLVSQLNRRWTERADPRPQLVDLRESGSLEGAATAVLFVHPPTDVELPHEVILAKHRRRGPTTDDFLFEPSTGTFRALSQH